jgi:hypothetical protein
MTERVRLLRPGSRLVGKVPFDTPMTKRVRLLRPGSSLVRKGLLDTPMTKRVDLLRPCSGLVRKGAFYATKMMAGWFIKTMFEPRWIWMTSMTPQKKGTFQTSEHPYGQKKLPRPDSIGTRKDIFAQHFRVGLLRLVNGVSPISFCTVRPV